MIICGGKMAMDMWLCVCVQMAIRKNVVALSIGKHQEHFSEERAIFVSRKNATFVGVQALKGTYRKAISSSFFPLRSF